MKAATSKLLLSLPCRCAGSGQAGTGRWQSFGSTPQHTSLRSSSTTEWDVAQIASLPKQGGRRKQIVILSLVLVLSLGHPSYVLPHIQAGR